MPHSAKSGNICFGFCARDQPGSQLPQRSGSVKDRRAIDSSQHMT